MPVYSPERRTALVFCGTGAHGAYHAGVLRALQEAGVKVDLVAGQGIGAATAALTAIDGGARLFEPGVWDTVVPKRLYGWKPLLTTIGWVALALGVVLLTPLIVVTLSLIVYPIGFLLTLLGLGLGTRVIDGYAAALTAAFASARLPTAVPRLAMVVLGVLVLVAFLGVALARWRAPVSRRSRGGWWWRLIGAPLDADRVRALFAGTIWQLIRGAAPEGVPTSATLGRRYAEVLVDNLGQPGFRELLLVGADIDTHRDVVGALLREPYRAEFLAPRPGQDRQAEVLDFAGNAGAHVFDLVAAALTPPYGCDPALVTFASDSFWRGETHRLCDRSAATHRLLEEVAIAGASQVLLVSAVPFGAAPHALDPPRLDLRSRVGEVLAAAERIALRDAIEMARLRFDGVYVVSPSHNAIQPFDFEGAYDAASDRRQDLAELMTCGYEDAYRQFIEPVVGASGEQLDLQQNPREHAHGRSMGYTPDPRR